MELVVATLYQLARISGKYDKQHKTKVRTSIVTRQETEVMTENYLTTGKIYIVDEDATIENNLKREEIIQTRIEQKNASKIANVGVIADALNFAVEETVKQRGRKPKTV